MQEIAFFLIFFQNKSFKITLVIYYSIIYISRYVYYFFIKCEAG